MDSVAGWPETSKRFDFVFMVVDRFSTMAHSIPWKKNTYAAHVAQLYVQLLV